MDSRFLATELSDEVLEQVVGGVIVVDPPVRPIGPVNPGGPMIPVDPPIRRYPSPRHGRFHGAPEPLVPPVA
jgi:hypothetical protein